MSNIEMSLECDSCFIQSSMDPGDPGELVCQCEVIVFSDEGVISFYDCDCPGTCTCTDCKGES